MATVFKRDHCKKTVTGVEKVFETRHATRQLRAALTYYQFQINILPKKVVYAW